MGGVAGAATGNYGRAAAASRERANPAQVPPRRPHTGQPHSGPSVGEGGSRMAATMVIAMDSDPARAAACANNRAVWTRCVHIKNSKQSAKPKFHLVIDFIGERGGSATFIENQALGTC